MAGARAAAEKGELAFGTIDSFLLWRLTGGKVHATDATNASRTMLFNIRTQEWDDDLLRLLKIPRALLPEVRDSSGEFGATDGACSARRCRSPASPATSRRRLVGQACFAPGMIKSTYGTGCFVLLNTGDKAVDVEEPAAHARSPTGSRASPATPSRAASSSPAPRCSGCATA